MTLRKQERRMEEPEGGSGVLYPDKFTPVPAACQHLRHGSGRQLAVQRRDAVRPKGRSILYPIGNKSEVRSSGSLGRTGPPASRYVTSTGSNTFQSWPSLIKLIAERTNMANIIIPQIQIIMHE
jgi:hypothetical protein